MKHYIGPQRYSTQKASMGAQSRPIDTSFITKSMAAAASVKDHMDRFRDHEAMMADKQQRLEDKANREAEIAAQREAQRAERDAQDREIALRKEEAAKRQEEMNVQKDFLKQYNAAQKERERIEKEDQKAWQRALRNGSAFDPLGEPQPIWVDNDTMNSWDWSDE